MSNHLNKKGLENVAVTISLIFLAIVAAGVAAVIVNNAASKAGARLAPGLSCLEMQTSALIEIRNARYNAENGDVEVLIKRSFDDSPLYGMNFVIDSEIARSSWQCGYGCELNCEMPTRGGSKWYYLSVGDHSVRDIAVVVDGCVIDERRIVAS